MRLTKTLPVNPYSDWVVDDVTALWFEFRFGSQFIEQLEALETPFAR